MANVVIFNGSPRKKGVTSQMIEEMIKGAEEKGKEVTVFQLNDKGVRGCQSCFYCRQHEGCACKDDLQPMYDAIKNADAIVFGSPIYFGRITGQAKSWVDRLYPCIDGKFQPRYPGKTGDHGHAGTLGKEMRCLPALVQHCILLRHHAGTGERGLVPFARPGLSGSAVPRCTGTALYAGYQTGIPSGAELEGVR